MSDLVYLTAPDGTPGTAPASQLEGYLAQGYRVRQPDAEDMKRIEAGQQPIQAGLEGAVRGLTMGFAEPLVAEAESALTGKPREQVLEEMRLRQQENPGAALVGDVAGALLGPGKAVKGVKALATFGGLQGLGSYVSEATLGNAQLNGEKAAQRIFTGAMTGVALGKTFEALGAGVDAVRKSTTGQNLAKAVEDFGKARQVDMLGNEKAWREKFGQYVDDIATVADEEGLLAPGASLGQELIDSTRQASARLGAQAETLVQKLDSAGPALQDSGVPQKALLDAVDAMKNAVAKYGDNPFGLRKSAQMISDIDSLMSTPGLTWSGLWKMQSQIRAEAGDSLGGEVAETARRALRDYVIQVGKSVKAPVQVGKQAFSTLGDGLEALNRRQAALNGFSEGVQSATAKAEARGLAFDQYAVLGGVFGVMHSGPLGLLPIVAAKGIQKYASTRGGFDLGRAALSLSKSPILSRMQSVLYEDLGARVVAAGNTLGRFRAPLERALSDGPEATLVTHSYLASSNAGDEYLAALGMMRETPEEADMVARRLSALDAMGSALAAIEARESEAIERFFSRAKGASATPAATSDYEDVYGRFEALAKKSEEALMAMPDDMRGAAPDMAMQAAGKLAQVTEFLDSKRPRNPFSHLPPAVQPAWDPPPSERQRWLRYVEAVELGPVGLLDSGKLVTPEHREALGIAYPSYLADLQEKLTERLNNHKEPLPYGKRLLLAQFLGPEALGMTPEQSGVLQAAFKKATVPQQQPRTDGRQQVNAAKNLATQAQRLEAR